MRIGGRSDSDIDRVRNSSTNLENHDFHRSIAEKTFVIALRMNTVRSTVHDWSDTKVCQNYLNIYTPPINYEPINYRL